MSIIYTVVGGIIKAAKDDVDVKTFTQMNGRCGDILQTSDMSSNNNRVEGGNYIVIADGADEVRIFSTTSTEEETVEKFLSKIFKENNEIKNLVAIPSAAKFDKEEIVVSGTCYYGDPATCYYNFSSKK